MTLDKYRGWSEVIESFLAGMLCLNLRSSLFTVSCKYRIILNCVIFQFVIFLWFLILNIIYTKTETTRPKAVHNPVNEPPNPEVLLDPHLLSAAYAQPRP